jgi:toxin ParE1/3/4
LIVAWLPRALAGRDAQLDYIAADNVSAAIEQGDRIQHQVNLLADHPAMGRVGRKRGTRELVISRTPFVIVYRVRRSTQRVEILRVLHGAQQWPPSDRLKL